MPKLNQDDLGLFLLVTHQHKDNQDLFFVVPLTTVDAGKSPYDVNVPEWGTLYTGRGLWLHREDFPSNQSAYLPHAATKARQQLSRMVRGQPGLYPDRQPAEDDYDEHLDQIKALNHQVSPDRF